MVDEELMELAYQTITKFLRNNLQRIKCNEIKTSEIAKKKPTIIFFNLSLKRHLPILLILKKDN